MILVPAGSYLMGSRSGDAERAGLPAERAAAERPQHKVTIASAFLIGVSEVTRRQFAAFAQATRYDPKGACTVYDKVLSAFAASPTANWQRPGFAQTDQDPVVCVDWRDASAFASWLSSKTGKNYRLPSEAEWEYAARAGTRTSRYWGNESAVACAYADVFDFSDVAARANRTDDGDYFHCTDSYAFTAPVGKFRPNAFGLYDVIGNVWEWTQDCFNVSYENAPNDGRAWQRGDCGRRIARGGSWTSPARHVSVSFRDPDLATYRSSYLGFRVARDE